MTALILLLSVLWGADANRPQDDRSIQVEVGAHSLQVDSLTPEASATQMPTCIAVIDKDFSTFTAYAFDPTTKQQVAKCDSSEILFSDPLNQGGLVDGDVLRNITAPAFFEKMEAGATEGFTVDSVVAYLCKLYDQCLVKLAQTCKSFTQVSVYETGKLRKKLEGALEYDALKQKWTTAMTDHMAPILSELHKHTLKSSPERDNPKYHFDFLDYKEQFKLEGGDYFRSKLKDFNLELDDPLDAETVIAVGFGFPTKYAWYAYAYPKPNVSSSTGLDEVQLGNGNLAPETPASGAFGNLIRVATGLKTNDLSYKVVVALDMVADLAESVIGALQKCACGKDEAESMGTCLDKSRSGVQNGTSKEEICTQTSTLESALATHKRIPVASVKTLAQWVRDNYDPPVEGPEKKSKEVGDPATFLSGFLVACDDFLVEDVIFDNVNHPGRGNWAREMLQDAVTVAAPTPTSEASEACVCGKECLTITADDKSLSCLCERKTETTVGWAKTACNGAVSQTLSALTLFFFTLLY